MKIIIKDGFIVEPGSQESVKQKSIYILDGRFSEPFEPDDNTRIINSTGKYVIPGLTDIHVHFRDPGLTNKEDIITGSKAAARGGFTTVCCMPNTKPPIDNAETLKYVDMKGRNAGYANVLAAAAMTEGQEGSKLCNFKELDEVLTVCREMTGHGIAAISEDGMTLNNQELMEDICKIASELDLVIMDHAEPEVQIVKRDIDLAEKYGCKIHIQHISKAESIKLIREAKAKGLNITAEAAPHHFSLNNQAIEKFGVNAKMNPPLSDEKDRIAVLEGLLDDTIDIISTDHAPHTEEEKNTSYDGAPNGIIGLETAFSVSYTNLVKSGLMTFGKLIDKMSIRPLQLIGAPYPQLKTGVKADLAIVDIDSEYEIDKEKFLSKGRNTPFHGMKVFGNVEMTLHNGKITWEE